MAEGKAKDDLSPISILILGDAGVGKTTLVCAFVRHQFPPEVPAVLDPATVPRDLDGALFPKPLLVRDTDSSELQDNPAKVEALMETTDAVLLLYALDQPATLERLRSYWLPILDRAHSPESGKETPVVIIGAKRDLDSNFNQSAFIEANSPLLRDFQCAQLAIAVSAKLALTEVHSAFGHAAEQVQMPLTPLVDANGTLSAKFQKALRRIFRICDSNFDDFMDHDDVQRFQLKCFNLKLGETSTGMLFDRLENECPDEVITLEDKRKAITEEGFQCLIMMFLIAHDPSTAWTILHAFSYEKDLNLVVPVYDRDCFMDPDHGPYEFSEDGMLFLSRLFDQFQEPDTEILLPDRLEDIFSITAKSTHPFGTDYPHATHYTEEGGLTKDDWWALWSLLLYRDPMAAQVALYELGFVTGGDKPYMVAPKKAIQLEEPRGKRENWAEGKERRRCGSVFVLGAEGSGKSTVIAHFLRGSAGVEALAENDATAPKGHPSMSIRACAQYQPHMRIKGVGGDRYPQLVRLVEYAEHQAEHALTYDMEDCDVVVFTHKGGPKSLEFVRNTIEFVPRGVPVIILEVGTDKPTENHVTLCEDVGFTAEDADLTVPPGMSSSQGRELFHYIAGHVVVPEANNPMTKERKRSMQKKKIQGLLFSVLAIAAVGAVGWTYRDKLRQLMKGSAVPEAAAPRAALPTTFNPPAATVRK